MIRRPRIPHPWRTAAAIALAAVLATTAACGGSTSGTTGSSAAGSGGSAAATGPRTGGTAIALTAGEMPSFDPIRLTAIGAGVERAALVMDTLLFHDEVTDEAKPKLAKSMTSDDAVVWTLTLREGVTFSDGTPLDAEAVKFNLARHTADGSTSVAKSMLAEVVSYDVVSPLELKITLAEADGSFPLALTASSPGGLVGSPKALADPDTFARNPVGAGAFTLQSWTPDDQMVLVRNPGYWDTGKPYLDGVTYKVVPDPQTVTDSLVSGQANLALVSAGVYPQIDAASSVTRWKLLVGGQAIAPNASRPAGDERVRRAIFQTFDPQITSKALFAGTWDGNLDCIPFATGSPNCSSENVPHQDTSAASALIADWVTDGNSPTVSLSFFQSQVQLATYLQTELNKIGLDVQLKPLDLPSLLQAYGTGDYDLLVGTTGGGYPNAWSRLYSGSPTNWTRVTDPEFDAALLQARRGVTADERTQGWQDAVKILRDKAYVTYFSPAGVSIASTGISLDTVYPYQGSPMVYLDSAYLTTGS